MTKTQRVKFPAIRLVIGFCCLLAIVIIFPHVKLLSQSPSAMNEPSRKYQPVNGVLHLQTPVSGGTRSIDKYIKLARERGIGVVIITDHDTLSYEYAIYPLRWLVKRTVVKDSVLNYGVNNYLELIHNQQSANPDIVLIDGVESTPFYYWSGSFQTRLRDKLGRRELTLYNRGKHMLVMGLNTSDAYENLPLIANGCSRYDAYHGNQADKPYQYLIDYVNSKGGVIFWAHPEAEEKWMKEGVAVNTTPYCESILDTINYTGFSVLSEGYQKVGRIGGLWDDVLKAYCVGKRKLPVWAIGELDDYGDKPIDIVQTVFLLEDKSYSGVINAMKSGKMYAVSKSGRQGIPLPVLERFVIQDSANLETIAYSGDEIICNGKPLIKIRLTHNPVSKSAKVTIKLIKEGKLIKEYNESSPCEITFDDNLPGVGVKTYYRVDVTDEFGGKIVSNPIFVYSVRSEANKKE
jgi:hypothetical protein